MEAICERIKPLVALAVFPMKWRWAHNNNSDMIEGTIVGAKILQLFDSEQHPADQTWALLEISLKNGFNEALRQAAFDVIAVTASCAYDRDKVQPGDDLRSLDVL